MAGRPNRKRGVSLMEQVGAEQVREWVAQGYSVSRIQKEVGKLGGEDKKPITRDAYYFWLDQQDGLKEELSQIREGLANELPWEAMQLIDQADGRDEVSKAREQARVRLWVAERKGTEFKPQAEIKHDVSILDQFWNALKATNPRILEGIDVQEEAEEIEEAEVLEIEAPKE